MTRKNNNLIFYLDYELERSHYLSVHLPVVFQNLTKRQASVVVLFYFVCKCTQAFQVTHYQLRNR